MRRFLLDTGSASDLIYRRGQTYPRAQMRKAMGDDVGICAPVLGELWGGAEASASRDRSLRQTRRELTFFRLWPFDMAGAREYGRLYATRRRKGRMGSRPHPPERGGHNP